MQTMDDILHNHDDSINHALHQLTLQECNILFTKQEVNMRILIGKKSILKVLFLEFAIHQHIRNNKYMYVLWSDVLCGMRRINNSGNISNTLPETKQEREE